VTKPSRGPSCERSEGGCRKSLERGDTYTGALMESFYIHIAEGQPKATALRTRNWICSQGTAAMFHRIIGAFVLLEREKPRFLWGNDESQAQTKEKIYSPSVSLWHGSTSIQA